MTIKGRHWPEEYPLRRIEKHGGEVLVTDKGFRLDPQLGDFRFAARDGVLVKKPDDVEYFEFICPVRGIFCGRIQCGNGTKPPRGREWKLTNDNLDAPTLAPSIHCTGGCGWHGHITDGEYKNA